MRYSEQDIIGDVVESLKVEKEYPCVSLEGVSTVHEIKHIKTLLNKYLVSGDSLPLYIVIDGVNKKLGDTTLTLELILEFKYISTEYRLKLHKSSDLAIDIDLNDGDLLTKFILL